MVTTTIARSMVIDILSADQTLCGHNQPTIRNNHGHHYNQDYNTRKICHYCQEYGHVPKNYIRKHFKGNYSRWLIRTTCFSCLKTGHINRNCPTRSKAPSFEVNKGKEKVDVEHIRVEMNRTWQRRDGGRTSNGEITSPKRSSDHTSSN